MVVTVVTVVTVMTVMTVVTVVTVVTVATLLTVQIFVTKTTIIKFKKKKLDQRKSIDNRRPFLWQLPVISYL